MMVFGLISGILSTLRKKPKLRISFIEWPTFSCIFPAGERHEKYDIHRICIPLYLKISNIRSSASSIEKISIAYHWNLKLFSILWLKNTVGWYWLEDQTIALEYFQVKIAESTKVFPFITQRNSLISTEPDTFLDVGRSTNGMAYFEQDESWGGCFPLNSKGNVKVKVRVINTFGKAHFSKLTIPAVTLPEAKKYNPSFGSTHSTIDGKEAA